LCIVQGLPLWVLSKGRLLHLRDKAFNLLTNEFDKALLDRPR
jgi:hypothetical protein